MGDLTPSWHKFITNAAILEDIPGEFGGVWACAELWLPWPLKNRAMVMRSACYDALDESLGAYLVIVNSGDYWDEEALPPTFAECPRLEFESYTTFTPLPPAEDGTPLTEWTFYFEKTDYQVPLPEFVLPSFFKIMAPFVRRIAAQVVKERFHTGSSYAARMENNADFYGTIQRRCQIHSRRVRSGFANRRKGRGNNSARDRPAPRGLARPPRRKVTALAAADGM